MPKYTTPNQRNFGNVISISRRVIDSEIFQMVIAEIIERLKNGEVDGVPPFTRRQLQQAIPFANKESVDMTVFRYGREGKHVK